MKFFGKKSQSGFSLVELMIVVGIIGVLATLALPRFKQFQAKAKMAEAQNILQHVYTLEQSYALDNNVFLAVAGGVGAGLGNPTTGNTCTDANAVALGLTIEPCANTAPTPRFRYFIALQTIAGANGFVADARTGALVNNRICPGNNGFAISLDSTNKTSWAANATTGATPGQANIGSVCPN